METIGTITQKSFHGAATLETLVVTREKGEGFLAPGKTWYRATGAEGSRTAATIGELVDIFDDGLVVARFTPNAETR